jgi:hypothetical protein
MDQPRLLIVTMAQKCREVLQNSPQLVESDLPAAMLPPHLCWMCDRIEREAEDWSDTRLHRWIGFVQCGIMANRMLDLESIKAMFDKAKQAYGPDDEDLADHLDPACSFEMDLGGES